MPFVDIFSKTKLKENKEEIKPKIIVDNREKQSLVASELISLNCEVEFKHLHVGDYIVNNVIIERKTVSDFISSMLNKRLILQLQDLQKITKKLLLIEGIEEQELYSENNESGVNENAIRGFLLSILLNYQVPIIFTKDYEDTAKFLKVLAKKPAREQEIGINTKKRARDVNEQLQFIIEGFPGIGPKTAKKLLNEFKTIKNIINADIKDLEKTLGKKSEIFKIINLDYK